MLEIERANLSWKKSPYSVQGDCVELAVHNDHVLMRHSKDPDGQFLAFSASEWAAFVAWISDGDGLPGIA